MQTTAHYDQELMSSQRSTFHVTTATHKWFQITTLWFPYMETSWPMNSDRDWQVT